MTDTTDEFDSPDNEQDGAPTTDTPSAENADEPDVTAEPPPDVDHIEEENPNKREARYRLQLRETEAERDQLRATVEALQRAEVERLAAKLIQKPTALWSADVELSALLDDAGRVDSTKVDAAVQDAKTTLGLAPTRPPGYVGSEGRVVGGQPAAADPWKNAFTG